MRIEALGKQWLALKRAAPLRAAPSFEAAGLLLGAGTVLVKFDANGRVASLDGDELRLKVLLRIAYGRPISNETLSHVKAATSRWADGDPGQASLHLALAGLGRLIDPELIACRLFVAEELMRDGVPPGVFHDPLGAEAALGRLIHKYSPDQPRFPAGSGRDSGRWRGAAASASAPVARHPKRRRRAAPLAQHRLPTATPHPVAARPAVSSTPRAAPAPRIAPRQSPPIGSNMAVAVAPAALGADIDLGALSAAALRGLVAFLAETAAVVGAPVVLGLGLAFVPNPSARGKWVHLGGPNDLSYFRKPDETAITFRFKAADGSTQLIPASPDPEGNFRGPDGRVIARWVKAGARVGLVIKLAAEAAEQLDEKDKQPKRCPLPGPDHHGARDKDRDFEDYMKRIVNPHSPTPRGEGYALLKPNGAPIVFDDCQKQTGWMFDAKGTGYAKHFIKDDIVGDGMIDGMLKQSKDQLDASGGRQIVWIFAEKRAADEVRQAFRKAKDGRETIKIQTLPWYVGMR